MSSISSRSRSIAGALLGAFLCLCALALCIPGASAGRTLAQREQPFRDGEQIFTSIFIDVPEVSVREWDHPVQGNIRREDCHIPALGYIDNCKVHSTWLHVASGFKFERTDDVPCCDDKPGFAMIYQQQHAFAPGWGVEAVFSWEGVPGPASTGSGSMTAPLLTTTGVTTSTVFGSSPPRVQVVLSPAGFPV